MTVKYFPDAKHVSAPLLTAFDKGVDVSGYNKSACATKKQGNWKVRAWKSHMHKLV